MKSLAWMVGVAEMICMSAMAVAIDVGVDVDVAVSGLEAKLAGIDDFKAAPPMKVKASLASSAD